VSYGSATTAEVQAAELSGGLGGTQAWWRRAPAGVAATSAPVASVDTGGYLAFGALVAFTVILLISPQTWFPVLKTVRIAFLAAGIAMAAHVVERTARRKAITPLSPEIGIAFALVGWAILTLPMSVWPGGSVRVLLDHYLKAIAFFWLLGAIVNSSDRLRVMAWTLTLCSVPLAATGVANYFSDDRLSTGVRGFYRISGYGGVLTENPNDLALMLNLIIPIAGALVISERGVRRLVVLGAMALAAAAVILTFSRAGFLTLAATFILFLGMLVRRKSAGVALLLVLAAVAMPAMLPSGYTDRLATITNIEEDRTGSAQGRWDDLQVAVTLVANNPVVGAGIGQDILVMNEERGEDEWTSVHNAYLQYGVDLGIPGLLLFVWLHLTCLRAARAVDRRASHDPSVRDLQPLACGLQISLIAFGVAALFHPIAYQFYFFSMAGLAVALRNTCRLTIARQA
jgi:probable O-glycosylation ligase (exosortase A-associated)